MDSDAGLVEKWRNLLNKLSQYPVAESGRYGSVIKDSEWAPFDMLLRHPSLLMPIYPLDEYNIFSNHEKKQLAINTLHYVSESLEIGVFQCVWIACAAARLGLGDEAIRLLYEQGLDLIVRCNGLFSESTERLEQVCLVNWEPVYPPAMMEATGGVIAAVNEMLLQSFNGIIHVFPALPDGKPMGWHSAGMWTNALWEKVHKYPAWRDCAFNGMRAVGAFVVSAEMKQGTVRWVRLVSEAGCDASIYNPFPSMRFEITDGSGRPIEYTIIEDIICFHTDRGGVYIVRPIDCNNSAASEPIVAEVVPYRRVPYVQEHELFGGRHRPLMHEAHTHRRVFIGKDEDTEFLRLIDGFVFDFYNGNHRESPMPILRFDFTELQGKNYSTILQPQRHRDSVVGINFSRISINSKFSFQIGWGWLSTEGLLYSDRGEPDEIRRDFIYGNGPAVFRFELPRGRYDLLIICGDNEAANSTHIEIDGNAALDTGGMVPAGRFMAELIPIIRKTDGYLDILVGTADKEGRWVINALFINKRGQF